MGLTVNSVSAGTFISTGGHEIKYVGDDLIDLVESHTKNSPEGIGVGVCARPSNGKDPRPAHYKLDKISIKYKVGKKVRKKTEKLGYYNDYVFKMPKRYKVIKITVKYHKANAKEYKKLVKYCWWK